MWLGNLYNACIIAGLWRSRAWRKGSGLRAIFAVECLSLLETAFVIYAQGKPWWHTPQWQAKNVISDALQMAMFYLTACPVHPPYQPFWRRWMVEQLPFVYGAYCMLAFIQRTHYELGVFHSPKELEVVIIWTSALAAFWLAALLWFGIIGHSGNRR